MSAVTQHIKRREGLCANGSAAPMPRVVKLILHMTRTNAGHCNCAHRRASCFSCT